MKTSSVKKTIIVTALIAAAVVAGGFGKTKAQNVQPQFLITWRAADYAPSDFAGKILPIRNSPVAVSFELLNPSTGKLFDLSQETVYWYLNDGLVSNSAGVQSLTFVVPNAPADSVSLRIELPSLQGNIISKTVQIPVVQPEAIIAAPYPGGRVSQTSFTLQAIPYFFNVVRLSALNFQWSVNGETPASAENPNILSVNLGPNTPSGSDIGIGLTIQNPNNQSETATANANLTFVR